MKSSQRLFLESRFQNLSEADDMSKLLPKGQMCKCPECTKKFSEPFVDPNASEDYEF